MIFQWKIFLVLLTLSISLLSCVSKDLLFLEENNFELTITAYRYLAVLFKDESERGKELEAKWKGAVELLNESFPENSEVGVIDGTDPALKEIIDAYAISVPAVKIFRHGLLREFRGSFDDSESIAKYLEDDVKPVVKILKSLQDFRDIQVKDGATKVFGFFPEADMIAESEFGYGYPLDNWGQFYASADNLRGHATFYASSSSKILKALHLRQSDLPAIFMTSEDYDENYLRYYGEILEMNLSEWVLRNSPPAFQELSISSPHGELYATQFFSSRKLKFLLLLSPSDTNNENLVRKWKKVSDRYQATAIFTYITSQTFQDIYDYFNIIPSKDLPTIAAYNPSTDSKYKATNLLHDEEMEIGEKHLKSFVQGVIDGKITKILKTEPIPRESSNNGYVKKSVGKNILDVVSQENKDVLVLIYTPFCDRCKKILPTFDLLGRALQGDSRLALYKIDGSLNDLPSTFLLRQGSPHQNPNNNNNQISYPLLLWFPAKDKPYVNDDAIPRSYWNDAGYSLQELYSFIKRESSFDPQTLKIATIEQIGSLLADEEMYRLKYENEEKVLRRNEGRIVYDNEYLDWFIGEVVYDGKRWHLATAIFFGTTWILMGFSLLYLTVFASSPTKDVARTEVEQDGNSDEQTEDDQQSIQQTKDKNE